MRTRSASLWMLLAAIVPLPPGNAAGSEGSAAEHYSAEAFGAAVDALNRGERQGAAELADAALAQRLSHLPHDWRRVELLAVHAHLMIQLGRQGEAERDLDALRGEPDGDRIRTAAMAGVLLDLGRSADALALAMRAVRDLPIPANDELAARALAEVGRRAEAVVYLEKAVAQEPARADWRIELAGFYRMTGRFEDAKRLYAEAGRLDPRASEAYIQLGYARALSGDSPGAVREIEALAARHPSDPAIAHHLGAVYWQSGRFRQACAQFDRALSLLEERGERGSADWAHSELYRESCLERDGRTEEALAASDAILERAAPCEALWTSALERHITLRRRTDSAQAAQEVRSALDRCAYAAPPERAKMEWLLVEMLEDAGSCSTEAARWARSAAKDAARAFDDVHECLLVLQVAARLGGLFESMGLRMDAERADRLALEAERCVPGRMEAAEVHGRCMLRAAAAGKCAEGQVHREMVSRLEPSLTNVELRATLADRVRRFDSACPSR